jgi:filamentous hemagglutinin family protein
MEYLTRSTAIGLVLASFCGGLAANPTGPQVTNGQVSFTATADQFNVTNSHNAIINWNQFSIGTSEVTRFIQNSSNSNVLNRVTGNNPSAILGQLLSNGRVFLINPQGILFGPNAVVNTAGLIASTLNISDTDFVNGRFNFEAEPGAGDIHNQGIIRTSSGGEVFLLATNVTNSGVIYTPDGRLALAAGRKIVLTSLDLDGIRVEVQAPLDAVLNLGELIAERGAAEVFAGTIHNAGVIEANGVAVDEQGNVRLVAMGDIELASGSSVTANGASGGAVVVQSETGTTWVKGTVSATGSEGRGGAIQLLGKNVGLVEYASVNASGETGGGEVLIGGDYKGGGTVQTAQGTFVSETAQVRADALGSGDGGRVIVWADGATRSYGRISARGGNTSGNGGFVETSGATYLDVGTIPPDVGAPNGQGGDWLLDPYNLTIQLGAGNLDGQSPNFNSNANNSTIDVAVINAALDADTNVSVLTGAGGAQAGDLTVATAILKSAGAGTPLLTLAAEGDIFINAPITATSGGINLDLISGSQSFLTQNMNLGLGDLIVATGTATISAGVTVDANSLVIANNAGQTASLIIDNATMNLTSGHSVGDVGNGTLEVRNGSNLQISGDSVIGNFASSTGNMIVTGAGTVVNYNGNRLTLARAQGGTPGLTQGNLQLLDGATMMGLTSILVSDGYGLAVGTTTNGDVLVDNATLNVDTAGGFKVIRVGDPHNGGMADGNFVARNGAKVTTPSFQVGAIPGRTATATITGVGTSLITFGEENNVRVGSGSNPNSVGTLDITGGALVETLWLDARAQGGLNISGAGTTVNVTNDTGGQPGNFVAPDVTEGGFMRAGREAGEDATINITAGAVVNILTGADETGPGLQIARNAGSKGTVVVDNATVNIIQTTPLLEYGAYLNLRGGDAELTVRNGGVINLTGEEAFFGVGGDATGNGLVRITGSGSQINVSGFDSSIQIGRSGRGEIIVENGGALNSVFINVGHNAGSTGLLTVTGSNSQINLSGVGSYDGSPTGASLTIGRGGTGTVNVTNGGQILIAGASNPFPGFTLGRDVGGVGTLLVSGAGSRIEITSDITGKVPGDDTGYIAIGRDGKGTVDVRSGGQIINSANGITLVAREPGSEGALIVDGAGSLFLGGAVVHVSKDFNFDTFEAFEPGGNGTVVESNGGRVLGTSETSQAVSTNTLLSAIGNSTDTDTGDQLEEEPGLEAKDANESESEDNSTSGELECT